MLNTLRIQHRKTGARKNYDNLAKGQFLARLRDPIKERVRSRNPTLKEAIQVAVLEDENKKLSESNVFKISAIEQDSSKYSELDDIMEILDRLSPN